MSVDQRSPGDGYETEAGQWDAMRASDGSTRSPWDQLMPVLQGVDLTQRRTMQAVIDQMDKLVSQMEVEAAKIR